MAKFQITGGYGHVNDGRVYDEHPKFGRCKTAFVTWVCLVTGENQSKYYALSNLREVEAPRIRVEHVIPDTDWPVEQYTPRKPLVVMMPADMMASIRQAMYCNIAVVASTRAAA